MHKHNSNLDNSIKEENIEYNKKYCKYLGGSDFKIEANMLHGKSWNELGYNAFATVWLKNIDKLIGILKKAKINLSEYSLIDIGSGNGISTIYFAEKYEFKEIMGIEIAKKLHIISIENLKKRNSKHSEKNHININFYCENVEDFKIKKEKYILFMFNSLQWKAFKNFIEKNLESLKTNNSILLLANDHCINEILDYSILIQRDSKFNLSALRF